MPFRDLSDLPTGPATGGHPPDPEPFYAPRLAAAWLDGLDDGHRDMAFPEARIRHSWAGMCARKVGYLMTSAEESNPTEASGRWVMELGSLVHELWQQKMQLVFPDAQVEKKVWIEEIKSAGHIDLFHTEEDDGRQFSTAVELKTINGFGFKTCVGARGPAEGPRTSAVTQAALNGLGSDADRVVVINLAMENLSPREANKLGVEDWRRFTAEWSYPRAVYEPLAEQEVVRMKAITQQVDAGKLPPRAIPDLPRGARVTNPMKGDWSLVVDGMVMEAGSTWHCLYCNFRERCADEQ